MANIPNKLAIIVAVADNLVIGNDNKLLWHLPKDLAYFKSQTLNKSIIMGRLTFQSLGKPLPNRLHIVISSQTQTNTENVIWVKSTDEAIKTAQQIEQQKPLKDQTEIMIIGGGQIYKQLLPMADTLYITRVHKTIAGSVKFPQLDNKIWQLETSHKDTDINKSDNETLNLTYETWIKIK